MGKKKNRTRKVTVKHVVEQKLVVEQKPVVEEKAENEEIKEVEDVEGEELSDHECSTEPSTSGIVLKLAAKEFGYSNVKKLLESGADIKVRYREVPEIPRCDDCGGKCTCPRQMTLYERPALAKGPNFH
ncbi:hypothetical protein Aduo_019596 [Ancylostoma duodenale]